MESNVTPIVCDTYLIDKHVYSDTNKSLIFLQLTQSKLQLKKGLFMYWEVRRGYFEQIIFDHRGLRVYLNTG